MSVTTVKAQLAALQATISGVVRAYAQAPNTVNMTDMPCFVNLTGPADGDSSTAGLIFEDREYRMLLLVMSAAQGAAGEAETKCEPFFKRVRDFFLARPHLGVTNVQMSRWGGDGGVSRITYNDVPYYGIEFKINVAEVDAYDYAVGE